MYFSNFVDFRQLIPKHLIIQLVKLQIDILKLNTVSLTLQKKFRLLLNKGVSRSPSELIRLWLWSVDFFSNLALFWLNEMGQIWSFQAFWSCSVDFPHYGATLTETGHIWGFWALSGERVRVNIEGGVEAYFRRFASSSGSLIISWHYSKL